MSVPTRINETLRFKSLGFLKNTFSIEIKLFKGLYYPKLDSFLLDTGYKLNVYKTFSRGPRRLLKV